MRDARIELLASNLINHSVQLQKGEKVLIENFGLQTELVNAIVKACFVERNESKSCIINGGTRRTTENVS
jgi:leucyl aminopeptidase (aminopeptidase T)